MRFVFAIICFVLAAASIGLGIGQRTIFAGPDEVVASTTETTTSPVVVIDGSALNAYEQGQTVQIAGTPTISAAYGRTNDVLGWVGDATYTYITYDDATQKLVSTVETGTEVQVPQLAGSDLWLHEYTGADSLRFRANIPTDVSVIVVSDGITPAPSEVSIRWPLDNSTPWSGPLVAAGGGLILLGLALLIWALTHVRRSRGPRRTQQKPPKMPKLPRQPRYKPSKPKAVTGNDRPGSKGRRATRRMIRVVPIVLAGSLALAGCSVTASPAATNTPLATPSPTSTSTAETEIPEPAVSETQVTKIMSEIGTVVAQADANRDAELVATRVTGPALELRLANYKISAANAALADVATPIPPQVLKVVLPQQTDVWPRVIFAVVQAEADPAATTDPATPVIAPTALMLVQADARSNYKVNYAVTLIPGITFPEVSSATVGATRVSPDQKLLQLAPASIAGAYADIMMKDTESPFYEQFSAEGDVLRTAIGLEAQKTALAALSGTAKEEFTRAAGTAEVIAMSTSDSGALVAVQMNETDTVTPVKSGALANVPDRFKTLLAQDTSSKGIVGTYSDQLLFYVPAATAGGPVVLLGFANSLLDVKELP
ncbi:MAG: hypothetical protein JWQ43_703 [Glaciihabitans sp.]|nr:hypothetical protein [Glaciihabitans sp.]